MPLKAIREIISNIKVKRISSKLRRAKSPKEIKKHVRALEGIGGQIAVDELIKNGLDTSTHPALNNAPKTKMIMVTNALARIGGNKAWQGIIEYGFAHQYTSVVKHAQKLFKKDNKQAMKQLAYFGTTHTYGKVIKKSKEVLKKYGNDTLNILFDLTEKTSATADDYNYYRGGGPGHLQTYLETIAELGGKKALPRLMMMTGDYDERKNQMIKDTIKRIQEANRGRN